MLPEHGHLNRSFYLGKYLKLLGHDPVVFVGSHPHNSELQLISGKEHFRVYQKQPFPWVLIKTCNYEGSKKKRVYSMIEFYKNMKVAAKSFAKPDVIIGSSAHPLAALSSIQLGKKLGAQGIVEIRDFWPQSIVDFGVASESNILVKILFRFEKYLYKKADKIILTMENGYQYFIDKGYDSFIPRSKVYYLNNGIDLEEYEKNIRDDQYTDDDLENEAHFCVVYTGSIRKANNLGLVLETAKRVTDNRIRFLIWGAGDEKEILQQRCEKEHIKNVIFKGKVDKKYIPYITSRADLNLMHLPPSPVLKYGLSANKLFDYAAAGKPILTDFKCSMNPAMVYHAGISSESSNPNEIAKAIDRFSSMDEKEYKIYCSNAKKMAMDYSFNNLAYKLIQIVNDAK